jgi:hypothetical protein
MVETGPRDGADDVDDEPTTRGRSSRRRRRRERGDPECPGRSGAGAVLAQHEHARDDADEQTGGDAPLRHR